MRRSCTFVPAGLVMAALVVAASPANAGIANHKIEAIQKIVKDGKVVGARVHLLVDPDTYNQFRINVAPQAKVPAARKRDIGTRGNDNFVSADVVHRQTLAGARRGFVIKTVADKRDVAGLQEIYVDIRYRGRLQAGKKVNLLSTFTKGEQGFKASSDRHMHIYGAWDGPMNQSDKDYIIELPGADSNVATATKTLAPPTK